MVWFNFFKVSINNNKKDNVILSQGSVMFDSTLDSDSQCQRCHRLVRSLATLGALRISPAIACEFVPCPRLMFIFCLSLQIQESRISQVHRHSTMPFLSLLWLHMPSSYTTLVHLKKYEYCEVFFSNRTLHLHTVLKLPPTCFLTMILLCLIGKPPVVQ